MSAEMKPRGGGLSGRRKPGRFLSRCVKLRSVQTQKMSHLEFLRWELRVTMWLRTAQTGQIQRSSTAKHNTDPNLFVVECTRRRGEGSPFSCSFECWVEALHERFRSFVAVDRSLIKGTTSERPLTVKTVTILILVANVTRLLESNNSYLPYLSVCFCDIWLDLAVQLSCSA